MKPKPGRITRRNRDLELLVEVEPRVEIGELIRRHVGDAFQEREADGDVAHPGPDEREGEAAAERAAALAEREAALGAREASLGTEQSRLRALEQKLAELDESLERRAAELTDREARLAQPDEREGTLAERTQALAEREAFGDIEPEALYGESGTDPEGSVPAFEAREARFADLAAAEQSRLRALEHELAERNESLERWAAELAEHEARLTEHEARLGRRIRRYAERGYADLEGMETEASA